MGKSRFSQPREKNENDENSDLVLAEEHESAIPGAQERKVRQSEPKEKCLILRHWIKPRN
jgi:hypothetical protein